jgi:hypothetical protein
MQTSYPTVMGMPYAGLLAEEHPSVVTSKVQNDTNAVATGVFVKLDTASNGDGIKNLSAVADLPVGVALFRPGVERFNSGLGTGPLLYAQKQRVDVAERGRAWVRCEGAVAIGASLFLRVLANGANTTIGAVTATSDTTYTRAMPPGCRVITPSSGAGVVLLEFDALILQTVLS